MHRSWLVAALLVPLVLFPACSPSVHDVHESRFIMGTLVQFTIAGVSEDEALTAIRAASTEMQRVEDAFTIYGTQANPVKAFNAAEAGTVVALPAEVESLLATSLSVAGESRGAFDPAIGGLSLLWGFSLPEPPAAPPSAEAIAAAREGANYNFIGHIKAGIGHTKAGWMRLSDKTTLDFGAIAKGYAIDRGIAVLKASGVHDAILDAGGDMRVIGDHGGKPWRIGLRHPRKPGGALGWFEAQGDVSIVTSGDYERFFIYEGARYHHIIDPATGMPSDKSQSATVISDNATLADAWSTALFVLGEKGLGLVARQGMQGLLVDAEGQLHQGGPTLLVFHPIHP